MDFKDAYILMQQGGRARRKAHKKEIDYIEFQTDTNNEKRLYIVFAYGNYYTRCKYPLPIEDAVAEDWEEIK